MSPVTDLLDVALRLTDKERAKIVEALMDSLEDAHEQPDGPPVLEAEIERRLELFRQGKTTSEDWRVVMARLKADVASRYP